MAGWNSSTSGFDKSSFIYYLANRVNSLIYLKQYVYGIINSSHSTISHSMNFSCSQ